MYSAARRRTIKLYVVFLPPHDYNQAVSLIKGLFALKLFGNTGGHAPASRAVRAGKRPRRALRAALISLGCVLAVLTVSAAAYFMWEKPPAHAPTATPAPTASPSGKDPGPTSTPAAKNTHNDKVYTFLAVGTDQVGANTDTILVGALDTGEHSLNVISIPRDTLVNTPNSVKKVNALYAYDLNGGGDGITGLKAGIRDLLGFDVDCYAVVDIAAFEELVDAIGGVYFDVPIDMYYDDPTQNLHIAIPKGEQWLNGENALYTVRFRVGNGGSGYPNGDIGRIATQQSFLKSAAAQFIKAGAVKNLSAAADIFTRRVKTDLTAANISFFARELLLCRSEDVVFHTLPGNYEDSIGGFSYVSLYLDQWLELVNDCLSPWSEPITREDVNILVHENGRFISTTGSVEGGEDSFLTYSQYVSSLEKEAKEPEPAGEQPQEQTQGDS